MKTGEISLASSMRTSAAVRRFVDAFNRRDFDAVADGLRPRASSCTSGPRRPGAQSYRGPDGVRRAFENWFESWEWMQVEIEDIRGVGRPRPGHAPPARAGQGQRGRGRDPHASTSGPSRTGTYGDRALFTNRESALAVDRRMTESAQRRRGAPASFDRVHTDARPRRACWQMTHPTRGAADEWPEAPGARELPRPGRSACRRLDRGSRRGSGCRSSRASCVEVGDTRSSRCIERAKGSGSGVEVEIKVVQRLLVPRREGERASSSSSSASRARRQPDSTATTAERRAHEPFRGPGDHHVLDLGRGREPRAVPGDPLHARGVRGRGAADRGRGRLDDPHPRAHARRRARATRSRTSATSPTRS